MSHFLRKPVLGWCIRLRRVYRTIATQPAPSASGVPGSGLHSGSSASLSAWLGRWRLPSSFAACSDALASSSRNRALWILPSIDLFASDWAIFSLFFFKARPAACTSSVVAGKSVFPSVARGFRLPAATGFFRTVDFFAAMLVPPPFRTRAAEPIEFWKTKRRRSRLGIAFSAYRPFYCEPAEAVRRDLESTQPSHLSSFSQ